MRKSLSLILALILSLSLIGCGKTSVTNTTTPATVPPATTAPTEPPVTAPPVTEPAPTEPEVTEPTLDNTKLYGIDVTGMTAAEAKAAIQEGISNYKVTLTVNGQAISFTSKELSMSLSDEGFQTWFEETLNGGQPVTSGLINYNLDAAVSKIEDRIEKEPVNASITYNKTTKRFVAKPHEDGIEADVSPAKSALRSAVETLSPAHSARVTTKDVPAAIKDLDPLVTAAASSANTYLALKISYTYAAPGIPTTTEAISVDDLATFITADKNLVIKIDETAVEEYVNKMSYRNGGTESRGFITSHGTTISQVVDYYKAILDQDSMCRDLIYCLNNKISGSRTAPFLTSGITDMPYGGHYVEIDLNNQCLWLYKNGKLVIQSPLVSGKVSNRNWTPAGVFSIYYKETSTYLVGPTWRSYVDYWMAFNGGIGLHDANWRSQFGGNIYMYDGSHGCINLPPKNAGVIYKNVSVGTKVIVYGGAHSVGTMKQELIGQDSYTLTTEDAPFSLNIRPVFLGTTITYTSNNPDVVTVDENGLVTIVGPGTTTITVVSQKLDVVSAATLEISITVEGDEPEPTDPTEPSEPTEPTEPSEPTEPTEPSEPTEPTEPSEPTEPTEPSEPTEPEDPTEPSQPEATEPSEPEETDPPEENPLESV